MSGDPNDRAARLAGRWGSEDNESSRASEASEQADEDGVGDEFSDEPSDGSSDRGDGGVTDEAAKGNGEADADGSDQDLTTRQMQSQMLYLPPEFHKEIDLTFEELNLRFRREQDRKLEKNKDFYAGLLRLGLDQLGDVRDRDLDEFEDLLDL